MSKPETLQDIFAERAKWSERADKVNANINRIRAKRDAAIAAADVAEARAQRTLTRCYKHLGTRQIVDQIAGLLSSHFPNCKLQTSGPFGIAATCNIFLTLPETGGAVGMLQFRSAGDGIELVDHERDSGRYPASSIGHLNGLNHPSREMPDSIEGLAELLRASVEAS